MECKEVNELNEKGIAKFINLDKWGLSSFSLKIIAVITMFLDHFAILFLDNHHTAYMIARGIGRISYPIFAFILVEGFYYTGNRVKHGITLGVFAIISEIPYNMMFGRLFYLGNQNVVFTLFIGFMMIWALDFISMYRVNYSENLLKKISAGRMNTILELLVMLLGFTIAYFLNCSYSSAGIMLILCFYVFRKYHIGKAVSNIVFNMGMFGYNIQWLGVFSIIPIAFYNEKPGKYKWKYFFYVFYPIHILILVLFKFIQLKFFR